MQEEDEFAIQGDVMYSASILMLSQGMLGIKIGSYGEIYKNYV